MYFADKWHAKVEDILVSEARPSAEKFKRDDEQDERRGNYEAKERRGDLFLWSMADWMAHDMGSLLILRMEGFLGGESVSVEICGRSLQCFDEPPCCYSVNTAGLAGLTISSLYNIALSVGHFGASNTLELVMF